METSCQTNIVCIANIIIYSPITIFSITTWYVEKWEELMQSNIMSYTTILKNKMQYVIDGHREDMCIAYT